jgi:hypothetical protein
MPATPTNVEELCEGSKCFLLTIGVGASFRGVNDVLSDVLKNKFGYTVDSEACRNLRSRLNKK